MTLSVLETLLAAAFVALAARSTVDLIRRRDERHLFQFLALFGLTVVAALSGRESHNVSEALLSPIALIAFVGSGYCLLRFRATFFSVSRWAQGAIVSLCALAVVVGEVAASKPLEDTPSTFQLLATAGVIATWALCVAEPVASFWRESHRRQALQRARLRALGLAYSVILGILVVAIGAGDATATDAISIPLEIAGLVAVPLLWLAFTPPLWLRRLWQSHAEISYRTGLQLMVLESNDRATMAERALAWGTQLIGADAALLLGANGSIIAARNLDEAAASAIAALVPRNTQTQVIAVPPRRSAIVVPLQAEGIEARVVIVSGPFAPEFGVEDLHIMAPFAAIVAMALERTTVVERLVAMEHAKSDFLNLASHELRGPLTVLNGYLSMLAAGDLGDLPEGAGHVLPALVRQTERIGIIVEQMLETAQIDSESFALRNQECDLGALAQAAVSDVQAVAPASHRIVLKAEKKPCVVEADTSQIRTVMVNLIDNAVKYSPAGGDVECTLEARNGSVLFHVADHGIGIDEEQRKQLFMRFGRIVTPESAGIPGTGLGLYLAREVARRHGGDVTVADRADSSPGTVFTLTLPRAYKKTQAATTSQ